MFCYPLKAQDAMCEFFDFLSFEAMQLLVTSSLSIVLTRFDCAFNRFFFQTLKGLLES